MNCWDCKEKVKPGKYVVDDHVRCDECHKEYAEGHRGGNYGC